MSAVIRREGPPWSDAGRDASTPDFLLCSDYHGVQPMLHDLLGASDWPVTLLQELRKVAVGRAMWELRHQQVLARTLAALARIDVWPVLIKGTALAYSLYANPVLRARGDTDLIIAPASREKVEAVLAGL